MTSNYYLDKLTQFSKQPLSVQWRAGLVRLPWLVPRSVLHFTAPEGPFPELVYLPSRGKHVIPIYLFVPSEPPRAKDRWPVHLDFHGGGFIMGSNLEQAPWCGMVARATGRVVISVDYRKGPLDKFPAAIEDAEDVLAAILDASQGTEASRVLTAEIRKHTKSRFGESEKHPAIDTSNISLSGFSSGGNIALNLLLSVTQESGGGEEPWPSLFTADGPPIATLLFYPSFDATLLPHERPRPAKMKADSGGWFSSLGSVLGPTYLPKEMRSHPRASPGLNDMSRTLSKRARIQLILPEIDTLATQSETWVQKMHQEGLQDILEVLREEDMPHGWTQFPDTILDKKARGRKYVVFDKALGFLQAVSPGSIG